MVLAKLESIANLIQSEDQALPADVSKAIFRCLNLNTKEKKAILPLIAAPEGISITEMRRFTTDRFQTYELLNRILGFNQNEDDTDLESVSESDSESDDTDSEQENLQEKSEVLVENDEDLQEEPNNPVEVDKDDNQNDSEAEQPHLTP